MPLSSLRDTFPKGEGKNNSSAKLSREEQAPPIPQRFVCVFWSKVLFAYFFSERKSRLFGDYVENLVLNVDLFNDVLACKEGGKLFVFHNDIESNVFFSARRNVDSTAHLTADLNGDGNCRINRLRFVVGGPSLYGKERVLAENGAKGLRSVMRVLSSSTVSVPTL